MEARDSAMHGLICQHFSGHKITQHIKKGMKAQLIVGNGREYLPSIPGISDPKYQKKQNQLFL